MPTTITLDVSLQSRCAMCTQMFAAQLLMMICHQDFTAIPDVICVLAVLLPELAGGLALG